MATNKEYCEKIYSAMEETAVDGFWTGKTTYLFKSLEIPTASYAPVMRRLRQHGCVEQIQRGSRDLPSIFRLVQDPRTMGENFSGSLLTLSTPDAKLLEQRIEALEKRLGGLNVIKAIAELKQEIEALKNGTVKK